MQNAAVDLITEVYTFDDIGNQVPTRTKRTVLAELYSVGEKEFYSAAASGLNPSLKVRLADYLDYGNEKLLECTPYGGTKVLYTIIRAYRNGNSIELTCTEKIGDQDDEVLTD